MAPKSASRQKQLEKVAEMLQPQVPPEEDMPPPPVPVKRRRKTPDCPDPTSGSEVPTVKKPKAKPVKPTPPEDGVAEPKKGSKTKRASETPAGDKGSENEKDPKTEKKKPRTNQPKPTPPKTASVEPSWENFEAVQEQFGLTTDETTAVLLKVCGPDKRYQHYWEQYRNNNNVAPVPGLGDVVDPDIDGETPTEEDSESLVGGTPGSGSAVDTVETQQPETQQPETQQLDEHAEAEPPKDQIPEIHPEV